MTQVIQGRTPEVIATEIVTLKNQAATSMLQFAVEIGKKLEEVKVIVGHGQFGNWLEVNVDYSQSQANKLMAVYREYGDKVLNSESIASLDYSKAVALLSVPGEMRDNFIETHDIEEMSTRELKQAISADRDIHTEFNRVTKALEEAEDKVGKLEKEIEFVKSSGPSINIESGEVEDFNSVQVQKLEAEVSKQRKKAEKMKKAAEKMVDPNEHEKLKKMYEAARKETDELRNKPPKVETVEVIPKEAAEELERLKAQVSEGQEVQLLKAQFRTTMTMVNDLKGSLGNVRGTDSFDKYRKGIIDSFEQVIESLKIF